MSDYRDPFPDEMDPANTDQGGDIEARMIAAADEVNERIANCHEVVPCPRCRMPVGERCRRAGYQLAGRPVAHRQPLQHPHRERWTRVVPAR